LAHIKLKNGFQCVKCGHKKAQKRKDLSRLIIFIITKNHLHKTHFSMK